MTSRFSVVDFAHQILEMQDTISAQHREITRLMWYEEQYHELLGDSLDHNAKMLGGLLTLAMTPGVVEACAANAIRDN